MELDLGLSVARPYPGACNYPHGDILVMHRESTARVLKQNRNHASAVMALTTSASDERAQDVLAYLFDRVAPQMEFGRHALAEFTDALGSSGPQVDAAMAWTDGLCIRLAFCGSHRFVLWRGGRAQRIPPPEDRTAHWSEVPVAEKDWFIMADPATDSALPLGSILSLAQPGQTADNVCKMATFQAATADALNHHAVLALQFKA